MIINYAELYGVFPNEKDFSGAINRTLSNGVKHLDSSFLDSLKFIKKRKKKTTMEGKDKKLLLIDICGRLLYGIICDCLHSTSGKATIIDVEDMTVYYTDCDEWEPIEHCRPYLRSMDSMTEEECDEWAQLESDEWGANSIDWLNRKMFDYRGLIPMGLALEAPEGMYK